jgi:hypothetical protein
MKLRKTLNEENLLMRLLAYQKNRILNWGILNAGSNVTTVFLAQLAKKVQHCVKKPTTGPYPEPAETSPLFHTLFPQDPF